MTASPTHVPDTTPIASNAVVQQYARELVRKGGTLRVLALRAQPTWNGDDVVVEQGKRVLVRPCISTLAVREAMLERGPDEWLIVLTDRPDDDLGLTLLARCMHQGVQPIDAWHTVPGLFDARSVARDLRHLGPWVAAALVEHRPPGGYAVAPAGVVTRDHAMSQLTSSVLGLDHDSLDPAGLMAWTADIAARARWQGLPGALREGIGDWVGTALGPVARACLDVAGNVGTVDAVTIGLVADVLWPEQGQVPTEAVAARVRLETLMSGRPLDAATARQLAGAARGLVLRLGGDEGRAGASFLRRSALLTRAEALLADLGWPAGAQTSAVLPSGYQHRLLTLAAALQHQGDVEAALTDLVAHDAARLERSDATDQAEMAVRLRRWLAMPDERPTDLQAALLRQARDDGWVDRAAADVFVGSTTPEVAAAYAALCGRVSARRTAHDHEFAALLADATSRDLLPESTIPLESLVARAVLPLATRAPVLLVVVDGMSTAVAAELADGATARGWVECVPRLDLLRTAALAVLPTLTRYSRTSLFCGELTEGGQADEKRQFPALAGGPVFHKDDLRAGAGDILPAPVRDAVASGSKVVGVVLNSVDDALDKADPGGADWTISTVQHLGPLLDLAATHGRTVVLTSDHGHVVERGGQARPTDDAEARFRPVNAPAEADEVLLQGRRVLSLGGSIVAAVDEGLRYGRKAAGYHGGAAAAEVTVPVVVLAQDPAVLEPAGWSAAPPQAPTWWYEPVASSTAIPVVPPRRKSSEPTQAETLFPVDETPAIAPDGPRAMAAAVVASDVYAAQRVRAARGALDDSVVVTVLVTLLAGGGRAHRDLVAAAAGVPAARFRNTMAALRRVLNVEGYDVLAEDPDGSTVLLDQRLMREQFGLGPAG